MFGSGKINDDAVKLKTLIDVALNKYGNLPIKQLAEAAKNEFDYSTTLSSKDIIFRFKELDSFMFYFSESTDDNKKSSLVVTGTRKYQNFSLSACKEFWSCCTMDRGYHRTTSKAKKLMKVMVEKFDVRDDSEIMNMGRR